MKTDQFCWEDAMKAMNAEKNIISWLHGDKGYGCEKKNKVWLLLLMLA